MPRILITEPNTKPQPYRLQIDRGETKIGRAQDNDIIISDASASSHHCKIKRVEGGFILADSGSTNGIKHKGTQYSIIDLKHGQTVHIGDHINVEFTLSEEEIEELKKENYTSHQKTSFPDNSDTAIELAEAKPKNSPLEKNNNTNAVTLTEAKPRSQQPPSTKLRSASTRVIAPRRQQPVKSNTGFSFVIFMVLAVLCFMAGLAIRHYVDHQTFIFS